MFEKVIDLTIIYLTIIVTLKNCRDPMNITYHSKNIVTYSFMFQLRGGAIGRRRQEKFIKKSEFVISKSWKHPCRHLYREENVILERSSRKVLTIF